MNKLPDNLMSSDQKQAGVSLMLAVLVLSAISAIVFSLAAIVIIEIRSSGDVLRTEPAVYATLGVTEEALYQYKRFVPDTVDTSELNVVTCEPVSQGVCNINGVTLTLPGAQPLITDSTPVVDVIFSGQTEDYALYQVNDFTQQYGLVTVDVLETGTGSSILASIEVTNDDGTQVEVVPPTVVSEGGSFSFNAFNTTGQYDLVLAHNAGIASSKVSISTFDTDGTTPKGLPFIGQKVLKIVANYLGLTRSYTVKIPVP